MRVAVIPNTKLAALSRRTAAATAAAAAAAAVAAAVAAAAVAATANTCCYCQVWYRNSSFSNPSHPYVRRLRDFS